MITNTDHRALAYVACLFLGAFAFARASMAPEEFYGLRVGNQFVYSNRGLTTDTVLITRDSTAANGDHFFWYEGFDVEPAVRLTTNGDFYSHAFPNQYCLLECRMNAKPGELWKYDTTEFFSGYRVCMGYTDVQFASRWYRSVTIGRIVDSIDEGRPATELTVLAGIGLFSDYYNEVAEYTMRLVGARIDGVNYGTLTAVTEHIAASDQFKLVLEDTERAYQLTAIGMQSGKNPSSAYVYDLLGRQQHSVITIVDVDRESKRVTAALQPASQTTGYFVILVDSDLSPLWCCYIR